MIAVTTETAVLANVITSTTPNKSWKDSLHSNWDNILMDQIFAPIFCRSFPRNLDHSDFFWAARGSTKKTEYPSSRRTSEVWTAKKENYFWIFWKYGGSLVLKKTIHPKSFRTNRKKILRLNFLRPQKPKKWGVAIQKTLSKSFYGSTYGFSFEAATTTQSP